MDNDKKQLETPNNQESIDENADPYEFSKGRWHGDPSDYVVTTLEEALERQRQSVEKSKKILAKLRKKNKK